MTHTLEQIAREPRFTQSLSELKTGLRVTNEFSSVNLPRPTVEHLVEVLTALQTAAKQPDGADWTERENLGRRVREVWIAWAKEQPNPKPSWLVEWNGLSEPDKEVDRRIGETLFLLGSKNAESSKHAPRMDEQRISEADLNRLVREIACTAQKFKGDYQLTFDAAKVFLGSLLAGQVAGGEGKEREFIKGRISLALTQHEAVYGQIINCSILQSALLSAVAPQVHGKPCDDDSRLLALLRKNIRWSTTGHCYEWVISGKHGDVNQSLENAISGYAAMRPEQTEGK